MLSLILLSVESYKKYGVVVDAGGSSCDLYVYSWETDSESPDPKREGESYSAKGKLASAYYEPSVVGELFESLIEHAEKIIRENNETAINDTQFYVCGTSDLRDLDTSEQNIIIDLVYNFVTGNSGFKMTKENIDILTEYEEATFAFVSVNLALEKSVGTTVPVIGISKGNMYFAIEDSKFSKYVHDLALNGVFTKISVFSNKMLSTKYSRLNHTKQLARKAGTANVKSPCFTKDAVIDGTEEWVIGVNGTGNYTACNLSLTESTLGYPSRHYRNPEYFFEGIEIPKIPKDTVVYALGNYYTAWNGIWDAFSDEIPALKENNIENATISTLENIADKFCSIDNAKLNQILTEKNKTNIYDYAIADCLEFAVQLRLTKIGFNIPDGAIRRVKEINGTDVGYTRGVILAKVSPSPFSEETKSQLIGIIIGVIVIILIIGIIVFIIIRCCRKTKEDDKRTKDVSYLEDSDSGTTTHTNNTDMTAHLVGEESN